MNESLFAEHRNNSNCTSYKVSTEQDSKAQRMALTAALDIYTEWCALTFLPIFGLFAIFDCHFSEFVVPSNDENENHVLPLKGYSF